jgi:hypothetical protein
MQRQPSFFLSDTESESAAQSGLADGTRIAASLFLDYFLFRLPEAGRRGRPFAKSR